MATPEQRVKFVQSSERWHYVETSTGWKIRNKDYRSKGQLLANHTKDTRATRYHLKTLSSFSFEFFGFFHERSNKLKTTSY